MALALPIQGVPTPSQAGGGLLRLVSGSELDRQDAANNAEYAASQTRARDKAPADLAAYVRNQWFIFRNHRSRGDDPLNDQLLRAQRMFEGRYDPEKLAEITKFNGSKVYARLVGGKCRGATSLLREVYLGPERPWDIQPEPDPPVPDEVKASILQLVQTEVATQAQAGAPVLGDQVHMRITGLLHAAQQAARRNASLQASAAADKVEDILVQGRFYNALSEFLTDLPLFPFACMKGPVVRMVPRISWRGGRATVTQKPVMFWERVSPFDIYWTPGASDIADADTIERKRFTRADLNALIGLPGYDEAAIRAVLEDYAHGLRDWLDAPDAEQAENEGREDPNTNQSELIDGLEYNGSVQGRLLSDQGIDKALIPDPDRDYHVQTWVIGRHTIKTQLTANPRQRHPYYITSFEKVPGTVAGHGISSLLEDVQEVCNATLRSLVNNLAISSGPQVVVNDDVLSPTESDALYPWKRWHVTTDPTGSGNQQQPVMFFQPNSNAQELLAVYQAFSNMADEASAIPRYLTGESLSGGAGRTASGLSMLMGNAEKILRTVASNIDTDVLEPLLMQLYDMIMLTDTSGLLTGQEEVRVRGVNVAVQKETERQKQLQFLQITANPIDGPIVGQLGRARVLRAVAQGLGLPDDIVPDDQTIQGQIHAQEQVAKAQAAIAAVQGAGQGGPTQGAPSQTSGPNSPTTPAAQAQGAQAPQATPAQHADIAPPVNLQQGIPVHG